MKKNWPKIRRRKDSWQVDLGLIRGRRVQRSFRSSHEAEAFAAEKRKDFDLLGQYGSILTDDLKIQAVKASLVVKGRARLEDLAMEWAMRSGQPADVESITATEVYQRFIAAKVTANRRPRTIGSYRTRVGRFVKAFGHLAPDQVTPAAVEAWLDDGHIVGESRKSFLVSLSVFFNWARRRNCATRNPIEAIDRPKMDTRTPDILTAGEVDRILRAAQEQAPEMVSYFAIAFFAGLRTEELRRMTGLSIDESEGHITVTTDMAKNRSVGYVVLEDNLKAWLRAYPVVDRLYFSRGKRRRIVRAAGVKWKTHVARKTYASHHYAFYRDARLTAHNLRQATPDLLFERYRGIVTHREAEAYFRITPARNVIEISRAAG